MALNLDQIRALADRVARSHGLDVVDIEYLGGGGKHRTLRVYIEKNAEGRARLLELARRHGVETRGEAAEEDEDGADLEAEFDDDEEAGGAPGESGHELEDAEDEDFEDGESEDGELEDEEPGGEASDSVLDAGAEDEEEYDHEAFLASLPSVANLEHLSGVTHTDCEQFSRDFGTVLDVEELVPGTEYLLEVSSPGLDRRLQKEEDFERFTGSLVKLQTFEPVAGNRHWQGRLTRIENRVLTLAPLEAGKKKGKKAAPRAQTPVEIDLGNVEKANLVPEF